MNEFPHIKLNNVPLNDGLGGYLHQLKGTGL